MRQCSRYAKVLMCGTHPVSPEGLALAVATPGGCDAGGCAVAPLLARHSPAHVAPPGGRNASRRLPSISEHSPRLEAPVRLSDTSEGVRLAG